MINLDTLQQQADAGEQLYDQILQLLENHEFPIVMTVLTHVIAEVITNYSDDAQEEFALLAKLMTRVVETLVENEPEPCDCPKCTAARRAMH